MTAKRPFLLAGLLLLWFSAGLAQQSSFFIQGAVDATYTQFPFGNFDGEFHAEGAIDTSTFEPTDLQGVGGVLFPDSTGVETLFFAGVVVNPDTTLDALGMYLTAPNGFSEGGGGDQGITGVLFYLYRADSLDLPTDFDSVDVMDIIGLISAEHKFTGVPTGLTISGRTETELSLEFGALAIDLDNNTLLISIAGGTATLEGLTVGVEGRDSSRPAEFRITEVYPNPFNPAARVELDFPRSAQATLALYNLLGERLRMLHEGSLPAGRHTIGLEGSGLPSGTYLLDLETPGSRDVRRVTIVK